jgi:hypothetical protein
MSTTRLSALDMFKLELATAEIKLSVRKPEERNSAIQTFVKGLNSAEPLVREHTSLAIKERLSNPHSQVFFTETIKMIETMIGSGDLNALGLREINAIGRELVETFSRARRLLRNIQTATEAKISSIAHGA